MNFLNQVEVTGSVESLEALKKELHAAFVPSSYYSQGASPSHVYLMIEDLYLKIVDCSPNLEASYSNDFLSNVSGILSERSPAPGSGVEPSTATVVCYIGSLPRFQLRAVLSGMYSGSDGKRVREAAAAAPVMEIKAPSERLDDVLPLRV